MEGLLLGLTYMWSSVHALEQHRGNVCGPGDGVSGLDTGWSFTLLGASLSSEPGQLLEHVPGAPPGKHVSCAWKSTREVGWSILWVILTGHGHPDQLVSGCD